MNEPAGALALRIHESLRQHAPEVERLDARHWRFLSANGRTRVSAMQHEEEWLALEAPLDGAAAGLSLEGALIANGRLTGLWKYELWPDRCLHLCAEIPLVDGDGLADRLGETCRGLERALEQLTQRSSETESAPMPAAGAVIDLPGLVSEAGWPFTERTSGKLAVPLEAGGGSYQALVEQREGGAVEVWLELLRWEAPSPESRRSLAVLLLTACGAVRLARAAAQEADGHLAARFEAGFSTPPTPAELDCALAALSVACRLCAREAAALADQEIARRYLAMRRFESAGQQKGETSHG